jgi:multidrug efflux pump subunit AcrA (membrane-fusion protein)
LAAVVLLLDACQPASPAPVSATTASEPRTVEVAVATPAPWPFVLRATGATVADEESTLATKVAGRVEHVSVDLGSIVQVGDVIARIESRELELKVAQSEAALTAARTLLGLPVDGDETAFDPETAPIVRSAHTELEDAERERNRQIELTKAGVTSQAGLDKANARLATAGAALQDARQTIENRRAVVGQRRADLALARQALADAVIVAPFDGAIAERSANTGDYMSVGDPIARLVRFDPLRVSVEVPEREAVLVKRGQSARVEIAGLGAPIPASIVRTAPALDARSRTLRVELEIENKSLELRPGAFAAADITVDPTRTGLAIPTAALVSFAGVEKVFLVEGDVANEHRITVGRRDTERIEVLAGIDAGARVVLSPGNLRSGAAVRVVP